MRTVIIVGLVCPQAQVPVFLFACRDFQEEI
jgi:hypothetical protein